MIVHGYAKSSMVEEDGTFKLKVRIPSIHGPYSLSDYRGRRPVNYVRDEDLPYYNSVILPKTVEDGDVVVLTTNNDDSSHFFVLGLTGSSYFTNSTLGG